MKTFILITITLFFSSITFAGDDLLSLLNHVEFNEKLMAKSMGITAKQELSSILEKLEKFDESKQNQFTIEFKNKLIQRVRENLEKKDQTLSTCQYQANKYENELTAWVDNKVKNREDSLNRWMKLRLVKFDIEKNKNCPELQKLWTLIDKIKFDSFI